jgi:hypothetical protein
MIGKGNIVQMHVKQPPGVRHIQNIDVKRLSRYLLAMVISGAIFIVYLWKRDPGYIDVTRTKR